MRITILIVLEFRVLHPQSQFINDILLFFQSFLRCEDFDMFFSGYPKPTLVFSYAFLYTCCQVVQEFSKIIYLIVSIVGIFDLISFLVKWAYYSCFPFVWYLFWIPYIFIQMLQQLVCYFVSSYKFIPRFQMPCFTQFSSLPFLVPCTFS